MSQKEKRMYKDHIINTLKRREKQSTAALADAVGLSQSQCYRLIKELNEANYVVPSENKKWSLSKKNH